MAGMRNGSIRRKRGDPFRASTTRSYEKALRLRVLPELGGRRLSDVRRLDVQDFADGLLAEGHAPSTIEVTVAALRAVCSRAVSRGDLTVNPCDGIELPAVRNGRDRIVDPQGAARLLAALPEGDRPGVGDRPVRGPSARRDHGAALGGHRPEGGRAPPRAFVGRHRRAGRSRGTGAGRCRSPQSCASSSWR